MQQIESHARRNPHDQYAQLLWRHLATTAAQYEQQRMDMQAQTQALQGAPAGVSLRQPSQQPGFPQMPVQPVPSTLPAGLAPAPPRGQERKKFNMVAGSGSRFPRLGVHQARRSIRQRRREHRRQGAIVIPAQDHLGAIALDHDQRAKMSTKTALRLAPALSLRSQLSVVKQKCLRSNMKCSRMQATSAKVPRSVSPKLSRSFKSNSKRLKTRSRMLPPHERESTLTSAILLFSKLKVQKPLQLKRRPLQLLQAGLQSHGLLCLPPGRLSSQHVTDPLERMPCRPTSMGVRALSLCSRTRPLEQGG